MALSKRIPVGHGVVFGCGAFLASPVEPVMDFHASPREDGSRPQQIDRDSGLPLWQVQVIDADPEATKRGKTVTVKIAAKHQPVPPASEASFPFTPVEFVNLTVLAYVDDSGPGRARVAWSYKASSLVAPEKANSVKGAA